MSSFLEHVAADLLNRYGTNLAKVAVVFPNKRASLFLNEHLARLSGKPLWSPTYITISDLFRSHSQWKVADPILLVCELHKCFIEATGMDETLDHFYGWGQLLLADFDDLDKNMGPADQVFKNLRDIHELDDISYLTEEQREIIKRFFSNFSEDHNSELKQRFLRLWSRIGTIYHSYNERLASQQLCYEGALYRQVVENPDIEFRYDTYAFVGFNHLQKVEKTLFRRLEQAGKAIFYQDTEEQPPEELTYISAPTENIQARFVSQWLTPERIAAGKRTAIVLCDEKLLQTVIHCLPEGIGKINVTTGYPLSQTAAATLVSQFFNLQINGFSLKTGAFRKHWLDLMGRHPYAKMMPEDYASTHYTDNGELLHALLGIIRHVAKDPSPKDQLATESLFRVYTVLNRITDLVDSGVLKVDIITLQRLVTQVIQSTTIPFHGEPAEGIQIMGVLETRNLDFDHVLMLSCNEGNMPRGVSDTSFIPYSIRKAYSLTTVDHKVAIYEHYFHRLLQRAKDVTLVYNNATNDGQTGEMSRFMLQQMVEREKPIHYQTLQAGQQTTLRHPKEIVKTDKIMTILKERFSKENGGISPTAISTYLRCQLRFFYHYVGNLIEPDDNDEELVDNRIFGNIFHKAAQNLYEQLKTLTGNLITALAIDDLLKSGVEIEQKVDEAFMTELFKIENPHRKMPALDGLQLINREVIIKYIRQLLETDRKLAPFSILGLEKPVKMPLDWTIVRGYIDRLDRITDPKTGEDIIRVIDYKTGAKKQKDLPDVAAIFDPTNVKEHSDYYLQAFLYSHIIRRETQAPVSPLLLFIQHAGADEYDPTLKLGKEPVRDIAAVSDEFMTLLTEKMSEIFCQDLAFSPTEDHERCSSCPYKKLCQ
jgi:CRISPR/Cas system-associated exonuclease Cas4 (RecB family)